MTELQTGNVLILLPKLLLTISHFEVDQVLAFFICGEITKHRYFYLSILNIEWVFCVCGAGWFSEHLSTSIICSAGCLHNMCVTAVLQHGVIKIKWEETPKILKINFNMCGVAAVYTRCVFQSWKI